MTKKTCLTPLVIVICSCWFLACNKSRAPQAVTEAATALRKLQANLDVGVRFEDYDSLVREANLAVSEASAELPDGELKRELKATMGAYLDARSVWAYQQANGDRLMRDSPIGQAMITKYALKTYEWYSEPTPAKEGYVVAMPAGNPLYAEVGEAHARIWEAAKGHLERVNALLRA